MATRGSEKTSDVPGEIEHQQCESIGVNAALFVTDVNTYSSAHGSGSMFIFNHSIDAGVTSSHPPTYFRAYGDGRLTNFWALGGSTLGSKTMSVDIKRPNCACTSLTEFTSSYLNEGFAYFITFEDGYVLRAGPSMSVLVPIQYCTATECVSKVIPKTLEDLQIGDLVCKCGNTGTTNEVSQDCVLVSGKQAWGLFDANLTASITHNIKTSFPQDHPDFTTSECTACFMVENGIYVLAIPNGGSY